MPYIVVDGAGDAVALRKCCHTDLRILILDQGVVALLQGRCEFLAVILCPVKFETEQVEMTGVTVQQQGTECCDKAACIAGDSWKQYRNSAAPRAASRDL